MTKYRSKVNGNIVELSERAAALLVPSVYEEIEDGEESAEEKTPKSKPKRKKKG
jgi:hypothetical protein